MLRKPERADFGENLLGAGRVPSGCWWGAGEYHKGCRHGRGICNTSAKKITLSYFLAMSRALPILGHPSGHPRIFVRD